MKSGGLHGWQDLWIKHLKFCAGDTQVQITSLADFPSKLAHVYMIKVSFLLEDRTGLGSNWRGGGVGGRGQLSLYQNYSAQELHLQPEWQASTCSADPKSGSCEEPRVCGPHARQLCLQAAPSFQQSCSPCCWPRQTFGVRLINEINCSFKLWLSGRGGRGSDGERGLGFVGRAGAVICRLAGEACSAVRKFASKSLFTMPGEIVRAGKNFLQIFSSS